MWLCICSARWFEETFENTVENCQPNSTSVTMHLLREDIKTKNFSIRALRAIATLFLFGQVIWGHIWKHSGETSTKCNHCEYAFSHAGNLRQHLKTHTGEKHNKCNQCDYASSKTSHLRKHLKTSTKCNQCEYASQTIARNISSHLLLQAILGPADLIFVIFSPLRKMLAQFFFA